MFQKRGDNSLADEIKPEYWDFIFESFNPYCDIKQTDYIDLYFSITENGAKNSYNLTRFLKTNEKNYSKRISNN